MYHFNGKSWVRLAAPSSNGNTSITTNFHGISHNSVIQSAECSLKSPVRSSVDDEEDTKSSSTKPKRAPLKQLYPRTPTPFKKAYAAAVQKHGAVEQIDLGKSPELYDDLKEIILKDVCLPPKAKMRRPICRSLVDQASTSAASSDVPFQESSEDKIFDTTSTPSKVLNNSSFLPSPPLSASLPVPVEGESTVRRPVYLMSFLGEFVEPQPAPPAFSQDWFRIACGRTSAQLELTEMAKQVARSTKGERNSTSSYH